MEISKIYEMFDKIGCCTFATIDEGGYPETRIAHFNASDKDGLYFMTMITKPFYRQLKTTGKVSVCGLSASAKVNTGAEGNLLFDAGYFIRVTGDVKEISMEEIKAKNNPDFNYCIQDNINYPAMVVFCIYNAHGEVYDYDFEKEMRSHKLERLRFAFGDTLPIKANMKIDAEECIGCGACFNVCSFNAIEQNGKSFSINSNRCDECGCCYLKCSTKAIKIGGN